MIIVSNTSPIINLAMVSQLNLLEQLYLNINLAQAVYDEIVVAGAGKPGASEVQKASWLQVHQVANTPLVKALELELDIGEAETIALAVELKADLVLLDERRGRKVATRLGLNKIGILGMLFEAKNKGLLPSIKPVLDDLITKAGFWIRDQLYVHVLQAAGEYNP
jgi:predicted nucleic acid-binding protein